MTITSSAIRANAMVDRLAKAVRTAHETLNHEDIGEPYSVMPFVSSVDERTVNGIALLVGPAAMDAFILLALDERGRSCRGAEIECAAVDGAGLSVTLDADNLVAISGLGDAAAIAEGIDLALASLARTQACERSLGDADLDLGDLINFLSNTTNTTRN